MSDHTPEYITIQLTKGQTTIIDVVDADLADLKWYTHKAKDRYYAMRTKRTKLDKHNIMLHKVILERMLDRPLEKDEMPDHVNTNNPLDNRRSNLRVANCSQNNMNKKKPSSNTSGYKGVAWDRCVGKWKVMIQYNYKKKHIGYFDNIEDAAQAYADASAKYHGEFGRTK